MIEYISKGQAKKILCEMCNEINSDEPCEPCECEWMIAVEKMSGLYCPNCGAKIQEAAYGK